MSKRAASKDSKASGFKMLKTLFTSGPKNSSPSSNASTPELDDPKTSTTEIENPRTSNPETPKPGPSRLEPLVHLATLEDKILSSLNCISPPYEILYLLSSASTISAHWT